MSLLTRGSPLGLAGLLSHLNPTYGTYTAVYELDGDPDPLIGQVRAPLGAQTAQLTFLMPAKSCNLIALPALLEHLAVKAGTWGMPNVSGEVDEHTAVFESLRRSGFALYTWQRIWQFNPATLENCRDDSGSRWEEAGSMDSLAIRLLCQSVVPALVQPVELASLARPAGLLLRRNGDLLAFAEVVSGPRGTWVKPYMHPAAEVEVSDLAASLLGSLPYNEGRPVYLCVRSYQAWLEPVLEAFNAQVGPRQAVMVKRLVVPVKDAVAVDAQHARPEAAVPFAQANGQVKLSRDGKN